MQEYNIEDAVAYLKIEATKALDEKDEMKAYDIVRYTNAIVATVSDNDDLYVSLYDLRKECEKRRGEVNEQR